MDQDEGQLASRPVMVIGNLLSILLTAIGLLQYLPWTIVGAMILAILTITTFAPTINPLRTQNSHPTSKKPIGHSVPDLQPAKERTANQQAIHAHHTTPRPEVRTNSRTEVERLSAAQARAEPQRSTTPTLTLPKLVPASINPPRPGPVKTGSPRQEALTTAAIQTHQSILGTSRPSTPNNDPNTRIIGAGDLLTYDLQMDKGTEATCNVKATTLVNVYILDHENLTGLDLGEEFWSEKGEEGVSGTTLTFVAPMTGKWFLVVENTENKEASATVIIKKGPARTVRPEN